MIRACWADVPFPPVVNDPERAADTVGDYVILPMTHSFLCVRRLNGFLPTARGPSGSMGCEQMWRSPRPSRRCRNHRLFPAALRLVKLFFWNLQKETCSSKAGPLQCHSWQVTWREVADAKSQGHLKPLGWRGALHGVRVNYLTFYNFSLFLTVALLHKATCSLPGRFIFTLLIRSAQTDGTVIHLVSPS